MRKILIFLAIFAFFVGMAGAQWYPRSENYSTSGYLIGHGLDIGDAASTIDGPVTINGILTATSSGAKVGNIIDTSYGLKNSTANKAQVNLTTNKGLEFGTGATLGALQAKEGDGIDLDSSGIKANVTDLVGNGLEVSANNLLVKAADASLNVAAGGTSIKSGVLKHVLKDGTAAATNVTVSGMAVGDELVSVISYTNKTAIASMADRSAEYAIGIGQLAKGAGTNETGNQLDVMYLDRT